MFDSRLNLFCLVDGETASNAFPAKVSLDDTVGDLKKRIKAEKTNDFSDIDADKLTLWKVSMPIVAADKHMVISLDSLDSKVELLPSDDISDVYGDAPLPKKTIHII
ncbi:hypothetical protein BGZ74_006506, partial [Mortierella antarctica]